MANETHVILKDGRAAVIRPAVPDDASSITDYVDRIGAEKRFVLRERATWTLDQERATLAAADGRQAVFLVAEISGHLSGMIHIARGQWTKDAHLAELGMSCLPDCRRVGLGTALLSRGIEWARTVGVTKLTLEVFLSNEGAIALYRRAGFIEEARLKGQYVIDGQPEDSLLMAQWL